MAKLTGKQELFCQEYIVDLNATQAAIRAGYSEDTASETGYENLRKPQIEVRIAELMAARSERTRVTQDRVVAELAKIGFQQPQKFFKTVDGQPKIDMSNVDEFDWASVRGVTNKTKTFVDKDGNETYQEEVKLDLADKKAALDSLGRHTGAFVDKSEIKMIADAEIISHIIAVCVDEFGVDRLKLVDRLEELNLVQ